MNRCKKLRDSSVLGATPARIASLLYAYAFSKRNRSLSCRIRSLRTKPSVASKSARSWSVNGVSSVIGIVICSSVSDLVGWDGGEDVCLMFRFSVSDSSESFSPTTFSDLISFWKLFRISSGVSLSNSFLVSLFWLLKPLVELYLNPASFLGRSESKRIWAYQTKIC